jgi:TRAP transporter TAXI family solute receptor
MKREFFVSQYCLVSVLLISFSLLSFARADAMHLLRIGTGGSTGVYYPIGKLIAHGLTLSAKKENSALRGYIGVAQNSAGSIENTHGIISGEIEIGLIQADIAAYSFNGKRSFKDINGASSVRAIASLYPEKFQIVVRKDSGIREFTDIKGKSIAVDELGSGTLTVMRIILESHGISENDFVPLYLKPIFTREKMKNGQLQGFVMMAGTPMTALTDLYDIGVTLVPIEARIAADIYKKHPFLFPGKIEKNVYDGVPETTTLEVYALLVVDEKMEDDMAYAITEALFSEETSTLLREGHAQGKSITLGTAMSGISIPLHPGAERFYRQQNIIK